MLSWVRLRGINAQSLTPMKPPIANWYIYII